MPEVRISPTFLELQDAVRDNLAKISLAKEFLNASDGELRSLATQIVLEGLKKLYFQD
jgi:hypothetical protein